MSGRCTKPPAATQTGRQPKVLPLHHCTSTVLTSFIGVLLDFLIGFRRDSLTHVPSKWITAARSDLQKGRAQETLVFLSRRRVRQSRQRPWPELESIRYISWRCHPGLGSQHARHTTTTARPHRITALCCTNNASVLEYCSKNANGSMEPSTA